MSNMADNFFVNPSLPIKFWISEEAEILKVGSEMTHCEYVVANPGMVGCRSKEEIAEKLGDVPLDWPNDYMDEILNLALEKLWARVAFYQNSLRKSYIMVKRYKGANALLKMVAKYLVSNYDLKSGIKFDVKYYDLERNSIDSVTMSIDELLKLRQNF